MSRMKTALLAATLLAGSAAAWAQSDPTYDPAQLPETKGKVAQYTLTPRGDVDGLILEDGTEVNTTPRISTQLVFAIKPGDSVTIHGLKAKALPLVAAGSITNDTSGVTVIDQPGRGPEAASMDVSGTIKSLLHGRRGEVNGALLSDGTVVRLPPPAAQEMSAQLVAGKSVFVRGNGEATPLGRVIAARQIGADANNLTAVGGPPRWDRWMHDMMHGKPGPHGPGRGPDGDDGPPPPPPGGPAP